MARWTLLPRQKHVDLQQDETPAPALLQPLRFALEALCASPALQSWGIGIRLQARWLPGQVCLCPLGCDPSWTCSVAKQGN